MISTSLLLLGCLQAGADAPTLYQCERLIVAPGEVHTPGFLLVVGGKVAAAGRTAPSQLPAGARTVHVPGTIAPGLVDAHTHAGGFEDLVERVNAVTPRVRAADACDPWSEQIDKLRAAGITAMVLAPRDENVAGGLGALIKLGASAEIAADEVCVKLCLAAEALDQNRKPTAQMGAVELLRSSLHAARQQLAKGKAVPGVAPEDLSGLFPALAGDLPAAIAVHSAAQIQQALEVAEEFSLKPVLVHADEAAFALAAIQKANAGVVLSPLAIGSRKAALELPARLAAEKIRFAFASDAPLRGGPDSLRLSAALAVRNGCPRDRALAAITLEAAALFNQDNRVGCLRVGRDADWLELTGDPLDLSAQVRSVHVAGREVWKAKENAQ